MPKITNAIDLKNTIRQLENKQAEEWPLLKEQFLTSCESLKPINLLKNTLNELTKAPDFQGNLLDTSISLAAGYLTKKIVVGISHNPLKQILGSLLQMGVTSIASKNTDVIKSTVATLVNKFFSKKDISE